MPRRKNSLSSGPQLPFEGRRRRPLGVTPMHSIEHGDWRVPVDNPADAVHQTPLPLWRRVRMRADYLVSATPSYQQLEDDMIVPISGWPRFSRLFVACFILLPLSVLMVFALLVQMYKATPAMQNVSFWLSPNVWHALLGAFALFVSTLSSELKMLLVYIYVLGHEATHALAALLCMGRVRRFQVGFDGGFVETDKDNLFIALSPYFVPLWMGIWLLVFAVAHWLYPHELLETLLYVGFGYWWSFHLYWTLWVIPREQPDMLENGLMFSALVIMLTNIGILTLILAFFGCISLQGYIEDFGVCAQRVYSTLVDFCLVIHSLM